MSKEMGVGLTTGSKEIQITSRGKRKETRKKKKGHEYEQCHSGGANYSNSPEYTLGQRAKSKHRRENKGGQ